MPIQQSVDVRKLQDVLRSVQLTNDLAPEYTEVRMCSGEGRARRTTPWLPLGGIAYDRRKNLLEISVEDRARLVFSPKKLRAQDVDGTGLSIRVARKDGAEEILELR